MLKLTGKASDFLKIAVTAASRNDIPLVKDILQQKPDWISHIGSHGRTMLWEACHKGKLEMVKYLIDEGADINACGTHYTPYFVELSCHCIAKHKKHYLVADYLLESGARFTIHSAAFLGELERVQSFVIENPSLLDHGHPQHVMAGKNTGGLDFISADAEWATPLCYAVRGGDIDVASFLIESGARISGYEQQLFIAADDHPEMLRLLLSNGADRDFAPRVSPLDKELFAVLNEFGVPPISVEALSDELVYLCRGDRGGNPEDVLELLKQGADINHQDATGKTALHRATRAGFLKTMKILIDHGANIDVLDLNGETAIFETIRSTIKNQNQVKQAYAILSAHGANLNIKNKRQQTVLNLADSFNKDWKL